MRRAWLWLVAPLLLAAWPDIYPSRRIAVSAFRYNLISPELQYDAKEIELRYKSACKQGFSIACSWKRWQTDGRGDLAAAGSFMKSRCSWEPLACVVQAWSLSRVGGSLSPGAADPEKAAVLLEKACKKELFAPACTSLGELYLDGVGVPQDTTQAHALIKEGCDADDWWGCHQLGRLHRQGVGVDRDPARAAELFTAACDNAIPQSCTALGDALLRGAGVARDPVRAAEVYAESCSDRHTRSCATLASLYERGVGVEASPYAAIGLYQTACKAGAHSACYDLATLYAEGRGIEPDADAALELLDSSCAANHPQSCSHMGMLYIDGQIVDQDVPMGLELLEQGCGSGDQDGCVSLGRLYETGQGVGQDTRRALAIYDQACRGDAGAGCAALGRIEDSSDPVEALRLYRKACRLGDGEGCGALSERYRTGDGVEKDPREALTLLAKACENDHGLSCGRLGEATERGSYGLKKDPAQALSLYHRACRLGDGIGCMGVADMETDPASILAAYEGACDAGIEDGCEAAKPMLLETRYAQVVDRSLSGSCEIWGIDEEDVARTRMLASASGAQLVLHAGTHAGKTMTIEPASREVIRKRKRITGESQWGMRQVWEPLDLQVTLQERIDPRAPLSDFPGPVSYAPDPRGKTALTFSRDDGTVQRSVVERCRLSEGFQKLNAEGCSMTQALIAGQLLSDCQ